MLAGELYRASDPELAASHLRAQQRTVRFNALGLDAEDERRAALEELPASIGAGTVVKPGLRCDYGWNIRIGANTFINYDCVLLDCNQIVIGDEVQVGQTTLVFQR